MQQIGIIRAFCLPGGTALKKLSGPFFMDGVQLPQGYSHFEEAVYFLPFSSQKFLVLPGGLLSLSVSWGTEKIAGFGLLGGISTQADTEIYCSKTFHQVICIRVFRFEYQLHLVLILV